MAREEIVDLETQIIALEEKIKVIPQSTSKTNINFNKKNNRSRRSPRSQNFKMESKNGEIYFWRKKLYSHH